MLAAQEKQKVVSLLLQRGAQVDQVDADGWSALMFAAKADDATIEILVITTLTQRSGQRVRNDCLSSCV